MEGEILSLQDFTLPSLRALLATRDNPKKAPSAREGETMPLLLEFALPSLREFATLLKVANSWQSTSFVLSNRLPRKSLYFTHKAKAVYAICQCATASLMPMPLWARKSCAGNPSLSILARLLESDFEIAQIAIKVRGIEKIAG